MRTPRRHLTMLLAAAALTAMVVVLPAGAAKKKPTCKQDKEQKGCAVKLGSWYSADGLFRVEVKPRSAYAIGDSTVGERLVLALVTATNETCEGDGPASAFAGSNTRPKIGKSYRWTNTIKEGKSTATVTFTSAKTVTVEFNGIARNTLVGTPPCPVSVKGTAKRGTPR